jgi:hypothetical protein
MGFRRRREDEHLSASFFSVSAFEVQGISNSLGLLLDASGVIDGVNYKLAISDSLNTAARKVASDSFADDEQAWVHEHTCSPPYLLIYVGPTAAHSMSGEFLKEGALAVETYEAFVSARRELRDMEGKVMPPLLAALSCTFGTLQHVVRLRELEHDVVGRTPEGMMVCDFGVELRGELRVSQSVPLPDLQGLLDRAISLATRMSPEVSRFYSLALNESDPLKRFLYLFLTIERQTHATFKTIDHGLRMTELTQVPQRVNSVGTSFFEAQSEKWKSLQERFIWCALTVWTHLTDIDVESFTKVKKVRDQLPTAKLPPRLPRQSSWWSESQENFSLLRRCVVRVLGATMRRIGEP